MTDEQPRHIDISGASTRQRETMSHNIVLTTMVIEQLTQQVVAHLQHTDGLCPMACIGQPALEGLHSFDREQLRMLLTIALRVLADQRHETGG